MGWRRHASRSRTSHAIVILGAVIANRNPFIYLNNMGKVMTSGGFIAWAARVAAAAAAMFPIGSEAHAQASPWVANERGSVRLVSAVSGTGRDRALELGHGVREGRGELRGAWCGNDAAPLARHQRITQRHAQPCQSVADRRGGDVESLGGARDAALREHGGQHQKQIEVDRRKAH